MKAEQKVQEQEQDFYSLIGQKSSFLFSVILRKESLQFDFRIENLEATDLPNFNKYKITNPGNQQFFIMFAEF